MLKSMFLIRETIVFPDNTTFSTKKKKKKTFKNIPQIP